MIEAFHNYVPCMDSRDGFICDKEKGHEGDMHGDHRKEPVYWWDTGYAFRGTFGSLDEDYGYTQGSGQSPQVEPLAPYLAPVRIEDKKLSDQVGWPYPEGPS